MGIDPATLAIISVATSVVQGGMSYMQGQAQADQAKATANYNAQVIQQQANIDRSRRERQQRAAAATSRVRGAASGATLGSFEDVYESNKTQALLDLAIMDYETSVKKNQAIYSGQVEASQAKAKGTSGLISGLASAGTSLAGSGMLSGSGAGASSAASASSTYAKNGEVIRWNTSSGSGGSKIKWN